MKNNRHLLFTYLLGTILPTLFLYVHFDLGNILLLVINLIISYMIFSRKKISNLFVLYCVLFIFASFYFHKELINTLFYIYNEIIKVYNSTFVFNFSTITVNIRYAIFFRNYIFVNIFFQIIVSYLFKILNKFKFILFVCSIILVFPSLIIRIPLNWMIMTLLIIYWFLLFIPISNNINKYEIKSYFKQVLLIIILSSLSVNLTLFLLPEKEVDLLYELYNRAEKNEDSISTVIREITRYQLNQNTINLNDAKNRYYSNTVHLNVESSKNDNYYLKYFSGSRYVDNTWKMLELDEYTSLDYSGAFESISSYVVNESSVNELTINDRRRGNIMSIIPYYIKSSSSEYKNTYDAYVDYDEKNVTFEIWDIDRIVNSKNNRGYRKYVYEHYLEVPNDIRKLFANEFDMKKIIPGFYIDDEYMDSRYYEEAKKIILNILKEYQYTLKPGSTPQENDFVEYFLLESKKGYCVHYATVATLMFRYMGIPARYVEGYMIEKNQFTYNNETDKWKANILDSDAHAWVEIYDDHFGWMPIEVTVGTNIDKDVDEKEDINQQVSPQLPIVNPNDKNQSLDNENQNNPIINNENDIEFKYYKELLAGLCILCLCLLNSLRKLILEKSYIQSNHQKAIYSLVKYYEKLNKYQKVDNDELIRLFEKNKFSKDGCSKEEFVYIKNTLKEESKNIYKKINVFQRIKFKLIDLL